MQINFEFETVYGMYRDALHLDDNHMFTDEEIQAMKQKNLDNWIAVITAPFVEEVI